MAREWNLPPGCTPDDVDRAMGGDEREDIYDPCPECGNKDMKYVNHEPSWSCGMRTLEVQCPACEELFDVTEYEPDPF